MNINKTLAISVVSIINKILLSFNSRVTIENGFISNFKTHIFGPGKVSINKDSNCWAHEEPNVLRTLSPESSIEIGNNVRLNGVNIQAKQSVKIGNDCIIGSSVIVDTDYHSINIDRRTNPQAIVKTSPIIIGNNVWIAGRSAILKGVTIGDNSVVGFGSVVVSDVPSNVVVAGNPAIIIKQIN